jgi:beta-phosphoglucomutase
MHAAIFDFDGVIVDSEPLHYAGFRDTLAEENIRLDREDYYALYLGCDDHDCFCKVLEAAGLEPRGERIAELTRRKTARMQQLFAESIEAMPGAVALIQALAAQGKPLAICSGALREEIHQAARAIGVEAYFPVIVAAEDVQFGKPAPEGYLQAFRLLGRRLGRDLVPGRTVVIEDSPVGIQAGKDAGMAVLAVTTSYPACDLQQADRVVDSLEQVGPADLEDLVGV